jgi:hypothetical protein
LSHCGERADKSPGSLAIFAAIRRALKQSDHSEELKAQEAGPGGRCDYSEDSDGNKYYLHISNLILAPVIAS